MLKLRNYGAVGTCSVVIHSVRRLIKAAVNTIPANQHIVIPGL